MDPPNYLKLFLCLALCICVDSVEKKDSTKHDVFDELTGSESYDKRIIPQGKDGNSLTVGATLYVLKIVDMADTGHGAVKTTLDIYFRQIWVDPRLKSEIYAPDFALNETKVVGGIEMADKIWKPDTFFVNEESSEVKQSFVRINPSGEVLFSQRIFVCFVNNEDFRYFPWDVTVHTLDIESFGYTMNSFKYAWKDGPGSAQASPGIGAFGDLILAGHRVRTVEAILPSGNYSRLCYDVFFTRHTGTTVQTVFVPVALITCLALFSLVLPKTELTGKTVVLTLTSLAMIGLKTWLHTGLLHDVYYATQATIYVNLHLAVIILLNISFVFSCLLTSFTTHSKEGGDIQMRRLESTESSNALLNPSTRLPWLATAEMVASAIPPLLLALGQVGFWISVSSLSPEKQLNVIDDMVRLN